MPDKQIFLVTGGAGFLGSHLCDRLLAAGHQVWCLDNLSTGSARNIAQHADNAAFRFVEHDVSEPLTGNWTDALTGIFHLACPASPLAYQSDPIATTQTAVVGTLNMLRLAKQLQVPILQASTSEVYGDPIRHPQVETDWGHVNPIGPRACYDEGKRCAESLCFDFYRHYGVAIKVVRIFNTYGPRMHPLDGRVISNFIRQAIQRQPMTLNGEGTQTRSFCYVDDLMTGLIRMMATDMTVTGPINLGNPHEVSIKHLAQLISRLTHGKESPQYQPLPGDDPIRRCPDITRARQQLGWHPVISLEAGLRRTIAAMRDDFGQFVRIASSEGGD